MVVRSLPVAEVLAATSDVQRAGVIPYYEEDGKIYWVVAVSTRYRRWADWGGQANPGESALACALREAEEEGGPALAVPIKAKLQSGDWSGVFAYANLTTIRKYWLLVPIPKPTGAFTPTAEVERWSFEEQDAMVRWHPITQYQAGLKELVRHLRRYH